MVQQCLFFTLIFIFSGLGFAQDERYYRQILSGELPTYNQVTTERGTQFKVVGSSYHFDLNGDGMEEVLVPMKKDGMDSLEIRNQSRNVLFTADLFAMGSRSSIYKLKFVTLSKTLKALIIFLDEGSTKGRRFESSGRIVVVSFENNDLTKMTATQGPHFFHEREAQREQYWRRDYSVNVYDADGDGTKEISVQYNHIQRFMKYDGNGNWKRF